MGDISIPKNININGRDYQTEGTVTSQLLQQLTVGNEETKESYLTKINTSLSQWGDKKTGAYKYFVAIGVLKDRETPQMARLDGTINLIDQRIAEINNLSVSNIRETSDILQQYQRANTPESIHLGELFRDANPLPATADPFQALNVLQQIVRPALQRRRDELDAQRKIIQVRVDIYDAGSLHCTNIIRLGTVPQIYISQTQNRGPARAAVNQSRQLFLQFKGPDIGTYTDKNKYLDDLKKYFQKIPNARERLEQAQLLYDILAYRVNNQNFSAEIKRKHKEEIYNKAIGYCNDLISHNGKLSPDDYISLAGYFIDYVDDMEKIDINTWIGHIVTNSAQFPQSGSFVNVKFVLENTGGQYVIRMYKGEGKKWVESQSIFTKDARLANLYTPPYLAAAGKPSAIAGTSAPAKPAQKPAPQAAKPAPAPRYSVTGGGKGARYTSLKDYTNNGEVVYKVGERTSDGHYDTSSGWAYKSDENGERTYGWLKGGVFSSEAQVAAGRQETDDQKLARISPKWRGALNNAKDIFAEYNLYKQAYNEDNMTKIYLPRKEKAFLELSWSGGFLTIKKVSDDYRQMVLETTSYNLEKDEYGTPHLTKMAQGTTEEVFVSYNSVTKTKEVLPGDLFRIKHQELETRIKDTIARAVTEDQKAYYEYSAYYDAHVKSGNNLVYTMDINGGVLEVLELKTENGKIIAIKHDSIGRVTEASEYYVEAGKVVKKPYASEKPLEKKVQKPAVTEKPKEKAFIKADTLAKECEEIMTADEGAKILLKDGTMLEIQHSVTWGRGDKIVTVKATNAKGKVQKIKYEIDFNKREDGSVFTKTYFDLDGAKETKTKKETIFYDGTDAKIE